jgi:PatG Domain
MPDHTETMEHVALPSVQTRDTPVSVTAPEARRGQTIDLQGGSGTCACGAGAGSNPYGTETGSYVYAIGRIEARFPSLGAEKEFAQATGRSETAGKTDQQVFHTVLSKRENRYLVRQLCWVLTIQGLDTYLLTPRDPGDLDLLVYALRPAYSPNDIDVVIGTRGPIAPPEMCNGLMVPIVAFDQLYSFDRDALIKAIPRPEKTTAAKFGPAAEELFNRIMQLTDNAGATDEHRALNYLAMRYPAIYAKAAEEFERSRSLTAVEVRPSPLSSTRRIVEVIFAYTDRQTDFTEKFCVRADVTERFPFLVTKMSPYYDR